MNKCIYLKETDTTQSFEKQEHIFPAGIGGINKLPKGYVSDIVNGVIFSKIELEFMRNSPIALCRGFEGPGKRGSLSDKKATKSAVYISNDDDGKSELSYIKKAKPYSINQIKISLLTNKANLKVDNTGGKFNENELNKFISDLEEFSDKNFNSRKITYLNDKNIETANVLIGKFDSKWYVATNYDEIDYTEVRVRLKKIIEALRNKTLEQLENSNSQVVMYPKIAFDINNFYIVCVKMAFNYLASRVGQEKVLKSEFDALRKFVLGDSDDYDVQLMKKGTLSKHIKLPERCHTIYISKIDKRLVAIVSFYGESFNVGVVLCDNYQGNINMFIGICDWKNKREYNLI